MSNNKSIFRFTAQALTLFAVNILLLMLLAAFVGDLAKEMSSIYQLGSKGLASETMLQFLLSSVTIIALKEFFYSEKIFKKLMTLWRTVLLLLCAMLVSILFIIIFRWFSLEDLYGWAGFFICYIGTCLLAILFMIVKTKLEGRKYKELLSSYKEQHEGEDNHV